MSKLGYSTLLIMFALIFFLGFSTVNASEKTVPEDSHSEQLNEEEAENHETTAEHNEGEHTEHHAYLKVEIWSIIPFAVLLLGIAIIPLIWLEWWEKNRNKAIFAFPLGVIALAFIFFTAKEPMAVKGFHIAETMLDYVAFIALLGSLFIISGGIHISGDLKGKPTTNLKILAIGGLLASFIGTTGAAMLLIRPLLRANKHRKNIVHSVIFFIFIVANCGGLLTPLGDPPLFLGFLKGVPFEWTLINLWGYWIFVVGVLLSIYFVFDSILWKREGGLSALFASAEKAGENLKDSNAKVKIYGKINFLLLFGVIVVVFSSGVFAIQISSNGSWGGSFFESMRESTILEKMAAVKLGQSFFMMLLAMISLKLTPVRGEIRKKNEFTFYAIIEVAVLFFGIFLAMIPALQYLNTHGSELFTSVKSTFNIAGDQTCPMIPFWLTGSLSSFLDNAPTYLTFMATIQGSLGDIAGHEVTAAQIAAGTVIDTSPIMLAGLSTGAVFMGSMTYIGNGPNFMVKSIAEQSGVKMPSFFGYMIWSVLILIPIFILLNLIWFQCVTFTVL